MAVCVRHAGVAAVGTCPSCHGGFCAGCRVEDVARELAYCSIACRERGPAGEESPHALVSDADLVAGYRHPVRIGLALWGRCFPRILRHLVPLAAVMSALILGIESIGGGAEEPPDVNPELFLSLLALAAIVAAFSMALTAVLLSHAHTGLVEGSPVAHALRRFLPWVMVWILFFTLSLVGTLALIIPGIIAGIRLFWADEFALIEGVGPFAALRESWRVTAGYAGPIFALQFILGLLSYAVLLPALLLIGAAGAFGVGPLGHAAFMFLATLVVMICYASLHAPEVVYFYGLRAHRGLEGTAEA
jgi:hypothetical protein